MLIPPLDGVLIGGWIARWRGEQPALSTLTEKVGWQALVPYVLGCVVARVSNEFGLGIAPLDGIVVPLVLALVFGGRAGRRRSGERPEPHL